jgi:hypothetical protein
MFRYLRLRLEIWRLERKVTLRLARPRWRHSQRAGGGNDALDSLGHPCERLPAGVRDPHAHNVGLSTVDDHAITLRGCESGLYQFDHHVDREPLRTEHRLAVTVTARGKQFEGAAAVRIGTAIVASGRDVRLMLRLSR